MWLFSRGKTEARARDKPRVRTVGIEGMRPIYRSRADATLQGNEAIYAKPLKRLDTRLDDVKADTADLMSDRLAQAHDHWVAKGYCPNADKQRLVALHARYARDGHNHLAASFEQDLLEMLDKPTKN